MKRYRIGLNGTTIRKKSHDITGWRTTRFYQTLSTEKEDQFCNLLLSNWSRPKRNDSERESILYILL